MKITIRQLRQLIQDALQEDTGAHVHKPGNVKPTMMLGTSIADEDEDGQPLQKEISEDYFKGNIDPGYQTTQRFPNVSASDVKTPETRREQEEAYGKALDLFQMYAAKFHAKTPSDPQFVEFALSELAKDGTSDDALVVIQKRLENANGG